MIYKQNPFNITKAVDYSDIEIDKFWVDMPGGNGFSDIMKPTSNVPQLILGGKGSGKTHIMRYFSSSLQKIRHSNSLIDSIQKNEYLGIFLRCGGLNSSKFFGNNQAENAWKNIFAYYFELWLAQLITNIAIEIIDENEGLNVFEPAIVQDIYDLFDINVTSNFTNLREFKSYLRNLQKEVDFEVNNCAITGKQISELRIIVSPGSLIFGIPRVLEKNLSILSQKQFLYLIDEYENLLEYQQQYINTLIREREDPVSFRIGGRWYGVKTYKTFSGDEELKEGSEYEKTIIDQLLRDRQDIYTQFAKQIFLKRLEQNENVKIFIGDENEKINSFLDTFNQDRFFEKIKKKEKSISQSYLKNLAVKLKGKLTLDEIPVIIKNLEYPKNPLIERTNVFLFYREWSSGKSNLIDASKKIADDARTYNVNPWLKSNTHAKVLDKFKNDLIDQLHRENREKISYAGIDKIIKMSSGIPRHFLIMLKHIYRWSIYNDEVPYQSGPISEETQLKGIEDAIRWFLEDARIPGQIGRPVAAIVNRIGQLLHEIRFSDAPPECSLSSFSINTSDITTDTKQLLEYLEQYSYIIKGSDRREKNSSVHRVTYQINGLLAPNWELPIYKRGVLQLAAHEVAAIFEPKSDDEFTKIKLERKNRYNAPFKDLQNNTLSLFE
jgi:hypothetical protein